MRSMTVFNYLLEAALFGSVFILLVTALRALFRRRLGSRAVYAAWLLPALRLLLPISLPNPLMDGLRPGFSVDVGARPVADQIRRRLIDTSFTVSSMVGSGETGPLHALAVQTSVGRTGQTALVLWFAAEPWVRKLLRIKRKFGLSGESQYYEMPPADS